MSRTEDEHVDEPRATEALRDNDDAAPRDLAAYYADDALLDALGSPDPSAEVTETELGALLLAWRQEADSEPVPELVDTDAALAVIVSARTSTTRRRHRFLVPIASGAAVLAIAFTGVGLAAKGAQPGDTLWSLTKVLYAEHAQSVEAAGTVRSDLAEARDAMRHGDYADARAALDRARHKLDSVKGDDGRKNLNIDRQSLLDQLNKNNKHHVPVQRPPATSPSTSVTGADPTSNVPPPDQSSTAPSEPSGPPDDTSTPPSSPEQPPNNGGGGSDTGGGGSDTGGGDNNGGGGGSSEGTGSPTAYNADPSGP